MNQIDLNQVPPGHKYNVSVEREESVAVHNVRLFKDVALFVLSLVFISILTWLCVTTLYSPDATQDAKRWAVSTLAGAAGGIVGYLVKKQRCIAT